MKTYAKGIDLFIFFTHSILFIAVCLGFEPSPASIAFSYLALALFGLFSFLKRF